MKIVAVRVSAEKEERKNLSTSDMLKLAKSAIEGGSKKLLSLNRMERCEVIFVQYMICICVLKHYPGLLLL